MPQKLNGNRLDGSIAMKNRFLAFCAEREQPVDHWFPPSSYPGSGGCGFIGRSWVKSRERMEAQRSTNYTSDIWQVHAQHLLMVFVPHFVSPSQTVHRQTQSHRRTRYLPQKLLRLRWRMWVVGWLEILLRDGGSLGFCLRKYVLWTIHLKG